MDMKLKFCVQISHFILIKLGKERANSKHIMEISFLMQSQWDGLQTFGLDSIHQDLI